MEIQNIIRSLEFLYAVTDMRLQQHFNKENAAPFSYPAVKIEPDSSPFYQFLASNQPGIEEFIILMLALAPQIQPAFPDDLIQRYLPNGGDLPEIGGVKGNNHRGTIPTGETALFIIAGSDINKRLQAAQYFSTDHFFARENILQLETVKEGEPRMSGKIILQPEYAELFSTGIISKPGFGPGFPAKLVTTKMEWQDIVISPQTTAQLGDIATWLRHNQVFMQDWGMDKRVKPGFRALFYGPPGTGKTFAATLLGKQFQRDVYRIDLSQVVSKYIGETEKNLGKIFNKAENKDWILFFDEADALFGKRSNVQSAHDKYANQEVSYLLQRVEDFPGLIILASNLKNNLDQAFIRRFNAIIYFPLPTPEERYRIWKAVLPVKAVLAGDIDLAAIAERYELTGSSIVSIVHYASLQAIAGNSTVITKKDLIEGIKREYEKEGKITGI